MEKFRQSQRLGQKKDARLLGGEFDLAQRERAASMLTWEQAARVLQKRKKSFFLIASGITLAAAATAYLMHDVYRPVARVEIDPVSAGIKTLHEIEGP